MAQELGADMYKVVVKRINGVLRYYVVRLDHKVNECKSWLEASKLALDLNRNERALCTK